MSSFFWMVGIFCLFVWTRWFFLVSSDWLEQSSHFKGWVFSSQNWFMSAFINKLPFIEGRAVVAVNLRGCLQSTIITRPDSIFSLSCSLWTRAPFLISFHFSSGLVPLPVSSQCSLFLLLHLINSTLPQWCMTAHWQDRDKPATLAVRPSQPASQPDGQPVSQYEQRKTAMNAAHFPPPPPPPGSLLASRCVAFLVLSGWASKCS